MQQSSISTWINLGQDSVVLGWDCAAVIGLRLERLANGGVTGEQEANRMVMEKLEGLIHIQTSLVTGKFGWEPVVVLRKILDYSSGKVKANRRRLSARRAAR